MESLTMGGVFADFVGAANHTGSIHSVFDRVINIEFPELDAPDSMLSVGRIDVPVTCAMLVMRTPSGFSWLQSGARAGEPVAVEAGMLHIGSLLLSTEQAVVWRPEQRIFRHSCDQRRIREMVDALPQEVPAVKRLRAAVLGCAPDDTGRLEQTLWGGIVKLKRFLGGQLEAQEAVDALLGLGDGLTPSGDDILTGALYGLFCLGASMKFTALAAAVKCSMCNTNRISRHFLAYATNGIWGKREQELLFSALEPASRDVIEKTLTFTTIGASSGVDQLLGVLLSLQAGG